MSRNNSDTEIEDEKIAAVIERVLQAEQDKLHLKNPRGIREDIEDIIRGEIK
jgi:hypothetical protein